MTVPFDHKASAELVSERLASGRGRLRAEADRLAGIIARATPVAGCGPAIPVAPARGAQVVVTPAVMMPDPKSKGGWRVEAHGWRGFNAVQGADIFDVLARQAVKRKCKDGHTQASPFTKGQVEVARRYRDLVERHEGAGFKCASLEVRNAAGPSGGGEFMDAYLDEGRAIAWLQQQIGAGVAMAVRRVRPSARGEAAARVIRDRDLVDAVCLYGTSFRVVLQRHGWSQDGKNVKALIAALAACLDRMQGYGVSMARKGA